jgi:hypothetical protein
MSQLLENDHKFIETEASVHLINVPSVQKAGGGQRQLIIMNNCLKKTSNLQHTQRRTACSAAPVVQTFKHAKPRML